MFEEAQLYAPVTQGADGNVEVHLADDHPGVDDPVYRARRNAIAALALAWTPGDAGRRTPSTPTRSTRSGGGVPRAGGLHRTLACREYLGGAERLRLPADQDPAAGRGHRGCWRRYRFPLRAGRRAGAAARRSTAPSPTACFCSTQYIRHHSVPLYTPEPDVMHEVVGHANCLASARFAALYRVGR